MQACRVGQWSALACAAMIGFVAASGCAKGPKTFEVSGTVTYKGQPMKSYQVAFFPERGRPSMGLTDEAGKYKLQFVEAQGGALPGKNKVTVDYVPSGDDQAVRKAEMGQIPAEAMAIRVKYGDRNKTPLQFDIAKPEVIDLKLD